MSDVVDAAGNMVSAADEQDAQLQGSAQALDDQQALAKLWDLLLAHQFEGAYQIANRLCAQGIGHPAVFLAQAVGDLLFQDPSAATVGTSLLRAWADSAAPEQQAYFYNLTIKQLMPTLLGPVFFGGDHARVMQILNIVTAAVPPLRRVFDLSISSEPLDLTAMRQRGAARAKLLPAISRSSTAGPSRRAVIGMRDLVFPGRAQSRPHEIPPRIHAALQAYGWTSVFLPMAWQNLAEEYAAIATLCEQVGADVLILDDQLVEYPHVRPLRVELLRRLRLTRPSMQVVGVYLDPWSVEPAALREAAEAVDVVWAMSPASPIWREPVFAGKCLFVPFPYAPPGPLASPALIPRMRFSGGVLGYNWHRAFWLSAAALADLPVDTRLAAHNRDGLSASDSTGLYMRDLAEATCALNFSMRPDLSRIATGRCFETCLAGSLLIQESTEDLDYYLVPGEHYLEFTSFQELCAIVRFLQTRLDEAEDVRRRGREFAQAYYQTAAIVAALDDVLTFQRRSNGP